MFVAIGLLIILVATYFCYHLLMIEWFRKKTRIPLPPNCYPLIGHSLLLLKKFKENLNTLCCLSRRYDRIFCLWVGPFCHVFLSDPKDVEVIMKESKDMSKSYSYKFIKYWLGESILTSVGEKYFKSRKIIGKKFHMAQLKEYTKVLTNQSLLVMDNIIENETGEEFNMHSYISMYTMHGLLQTVFGVDLNLSSSETLKYIKAVENLGFTTFKRTNRVWLLPEVIFRHTSLAKKQDECLKILEVLIDRIILAKRVKDPKDDFLSLEKTRNEILTLIIAGEDTSSSTIGFTLSILGIYHNIQEKVVEEINEILSPEYDVISYDDVQKMKYLQQVVQEVLRLFPALPIIEKNTAKDIHLDGGYVIPKNTTITFYLPLIHRNPKCYPEPDKFNPENFSSENCKQRHPYSFIPFSANFRSCIGSKYAMISMKIFLATFLKKFKVFCDCEIEDFKLGMGVTLIRKEGFLIRVSPRNK